MKNLVFILAVLFFVSCQSGTDNSENTASEEVSMVQLVADTINIGGMYCDMCEASIEKGVNELAGIEFVEASWNDSITVVRYDASQTGFDDIKGAIELRGYSVKEDM